MPRTRLLRHRPRPSLGAGRRTVAAVLLAGCAAAAFGHGHPAVVDAAAPDAWKYRLCAEMTTVAIQALHSRDRGRPKAVYRDDGGPGPEIANAIVDKVYAEPAISSPKRAEAIGRAFCNERLQQLETNAVR